MKDLDFSGISTKDLRIAVNNAGETCDFDDICMNINCSHACPFYGNNSLCESESDNRRLQFKAELNRREKDMNEMPELKAGMIVDYSDNGLLLCLPNGENEIGFFRPNLYGAEYSRSLINKIYRKSGNRHYKATFEEPRNSDLELLWSKKSDKDIKIEELENTVKEALSQIQEIKNA